MASIWWPRSLAFLTALLCFWLVPFASAQNSVPIATNPILTTRTTTSAITRVETVGTTQSTSTTLECPDGTCIAITLIDVPLLATLIQDVTGTVVSTIGFTTIWTTVPAGETPNTPDPPATPTPSPRGGSSSNDLTTPVASATPTVIVSTSSSTSIITSGSLSGSATVVPVTLSTTAIASNATNTANAGTQNGSEGGSSGLSTKYVIVIAVICVVIGGGLVGFAIWFFLRRRQKQSAAVAAGTDNPNNDDSAVLGGRHELHGQSESGEPQMQEMSGDGYRGTAAPVSAGWNVRPELAGSGWQSNVYAPVVGEKSPGENVYEMPGEGRRYELR